VHVGRALAIAVAAVLAGAAPAGAAGWLPSSTLDAAGTAPALAVAANGTAVAVWIGGDGLHAARHTPGVPGFATLPVIPGNAFGGLQVGIDAAGNATTLYLLGSTLQASTLPAAANTFDSPDTLAAAAQDPALDVGPDGTAVAAWTEASATLGMQQVTAALRTPGNDFAGAPVSAAFTPTLETGHADVDVAAGGHAIVGWITGGGAASAVRPPDGSFSSAGAPSGGTLLASEPAVAIDGAGGPTLAWADGGTVQYSPTTGSGQLSAAGAHPVLAAAANGTTVAAWLEASQIFTATRPAGADAFPDGTGLAAASGTPSVAMGPGGDVLAGWADGGHAHAARRPAGSPDFEAARDLGSGGTPALGVDEEGSAAAAWSDGTAVSSAVLDAGAPLMGTVTVPATATAGVPADFTAAATDRWSAVGFGWAFGDGATATGGAVSHAFGAAGTPVVTVTASDAAGNTAGAGGTVTVAGVAVAPPPPPPPPPPSPDTVVTPRVAVPVTPSWRVRGKVIRLLRLKLAGLPSGATAELRCKGKRCPLRRTKTFKARAGRINLVKPLDRDQLRFKAGQRVELWVLAPNRIGLVVRWALKRGSKPQPQLLCVPLGAARARATC
jgi:hypothetical protein